MNVNRRKFIKLSAGSLALSLLPSSLIIEQASAASSHQIKAVAFDAFPIFDPRSVFKLAKTIFPDKGEALKNLWFNKIFGYSWLRTVGGHYQDFDTVVDEALVFSAKSLGLDLTQDNHKKLSRAFSNLDAWPDVLKSLTALKEQNLRLAFLSNMSEKTLQSNMNRNGINKFFEFALSTDKVQAYKPAPRAYQMAIDAFGLKKEEIAFVAFAGWDVAGAHWFGYPTVWINRLKAPQEELDSNADAAGEDLNTLISFLQK